MIIDAPELNFVGMRHLSQLKGFSVQIVTEFSGFKHFWKFFILNVCFIAKIRKFCLRFKSRKKSMK